TSVFTGLLQFPLSLPWLAFPSLSSSTSTALPFVRSASTLLNLLLSSASYKATLLTNRRRRSRRRTMRVFLRRESLTTRLQLKLINLPSLLSQRPGHTTLHDRNDRTDRTLLVHRGLQLPRAAGRTRVTLTILTESTPSNHSH
ncbi:hypothetical protein IL306_007707, partial [Fusarium sp. DS 682]